jgi:hypothetical protein
MSEPSPTTAMAASTIQETPIGAGSRAFLLSGSSMSAGSAMERCTWAAIDQGCNGTGKSGLNTRCRGGHHSSGCSPIEVYASGTSPATRLATRQTVRSEPAISAGQAFLHSGAAFRAASAADLVL